MANLTLELNKPMELRVQEFKNDPEMMRDVNGFINDLLEAAKIEAQSRQKQKSKLDNGIQNGTKRIGQWSNRARTSARTFATRIFTAICNCTTSVKNVVVNRN
ncbi:uncharacterized protein [Onthophagus taurus]|uniref:uncharacterized protein n=1 Tax=Onthophagus taurus TaxID=166361 RepID=UPI000C20985C|nr:uncharacterized protein LOC111416943 [Onthophagus taurus]